MLQLEYVTWDGTPHTHVLREGTTRIGRVADNDLQIDDLALSAHHCRIEVAGDSAYVLDDASSSGTFLDGELIEKATLSGGQVLNLGTFSVKIVAQTESGDSRRRSSEKEMKLPVQLPDGTYSCQVHQEKRSEFECDSCFSLFCSACMWSDSASSDAEILCPRCQRPANRVDWSGMERTREDVVRDLLPEGVQKALNYWEKYREWGENRDKR